VDCFNGTGKFHQDAVTGSVSDTAPVLINETIQQLITMKTFRDVVPTYCKPTKGEI
jgi:hypothetical protein